LLVILAVTALPLFAQNEVRHAMDDVMSTGKYETSWEPSASRLEEKPAAVEQVKEGPPKEKKRATARRERSQANDAEDTSKASSMGFGAFLRVAVMILGSVVLVVLILKAIQHFQGQRVLKSVAAPLAPPQEQVLEVSDLESIRLLANDGRLDQAIHQLVLWAIHRISRMLNQQARRHETCRSILEWRSLESLTKQHFHPIVKTEELIRFGLRDATTEDFERCYSACVSLSSHEQAAQ
jgi:hypothetical protein